MKAGLQISNIKSPIRGFLARVSVALMALGSSSVELAQTCPACYNNAAAQSPGLLQALKTGILVMMFPTLIMFIVIFTMLYRRRNSFHAPSDEETWPIRDSRTDLPPPWPTAISKPRIWL